MATRYLKPCECGKSVVIDTRSVGLELPCECGKTVYVPTISELKKLELAPDQEEVKSSNWSAKKGGLLLGLTLLIIGSLGYGFFTYLIPGKSFYTDQERANKHEQVQADYDRKPLHLIMQEWEIMEKGLNESLNWEVQRNIQFTKQLNIPRYLLLSLAGIGLLITLTSIVLFKDSGKKPTAS